MEFRNRIKYVLENELDRRMCKTCHAMWFMFRSDIGTVGYYRLGDNAPEHCLTCKPIDEEIEAGCIISEEQWVSL